VVVWHHSIAESKAMNCDFCATIGGNTKAVGQSINDKGQIVEMWCLEHAPAAMPPLVVPTESQRIAKVMYQARQMAQMTLTQASKTIGCTKQQLSFWEHGEPITMRTFFSWCRGLQVKPSEVLARSGL
jgi:DNA-binding Xre family transcriptional regulator